MDSAFLETIYCDDVRREIGNKLSFMGIYGPNILLNDFPAVLPKLCAVMTLHLPADTQTKTVTFSLYKDDEEIGRSTAHTADVRMAAPQFPDPVVDRRLTIRFIAQMVPFQLDSPCRLRARAEMDGEAITGGYLVVAQTTGL
jgi:hypothetical protein